MKKIFLLFFIPFVISAQNTGIQTSETNFQNVPQYFNSYFLNTYGRTGFGDVAAGFTSDPFLSIYSNPANLPDLSGKDYLLYLDFRSQRQLEMPSEVFHYPVIIDYNYYADSRLIPLPFSYRLKSPLNIYEVEPVFSIGVLSFPLKDTDRKFFAGATFQYLRNKDPFYLLSDEDPRPYESSYYPRVDYLGNSSSEDLAEDNYNDQLFTKGVNFSAFSGYKFSDKLKAGISISLVNQSRNGKLYLPYSDENYSFVSTVNKTTYSDVKDLHYNHVDFSGGVSYDIAEALNVGVKAGILSGKADQNSLLNDYYYYDYKINDSTARRSFNLTDGSTTQLFVHDGTTKYSGINFTARVADDKELSGFYRYYNSEISLSGNSLAYDTSAGLSQSFSSIDKKLYGSISNYSFSDIRNSSGIRKNNIYEAMLSLLWRTNRNNSFFAAVYYKHSSSDINNSEPAIVKQYNESFYNYPDNSTHNLVRYYESRTSEWIYSSSEWTLQIPIMINFDFSRKFSMMLGINKVIREVKIKDRTVSRIMFREQTSLVDTIRSANILETFMNPDRKIYMDKNDFIAKFNINMFDSFKISLLINPYFDKRLKIAQWVLSGVIQ